MIALTKTQAIALGAVAGGLAFIFVQGRNNQVPHVNVAFAGNSFQYKNDLPRLMEALSEGTIHQDSMLHGSLSFVSLPQRGNGMYYLWAGENPKDRNGFYDYGSCTLTDLIVGYDENLYTGEDIEQYYTDDGKNPCFVNSTYLDVLTEEKQQNPMKWDYVLMNDQSSRPTNYQKQMCSIQSLENNYVPLLLESGATPILFMTHGYWRDSVNMTELGGDVGTFTSLLYGAYQNYYATLESLLPASQKPKLAPVGLAFLLIWEENPDYWEEKLFQEDQFHPSASGTYLIGCVVYMTIYKRTPPAKSLESTEDPDDTSPIAALWENARKVEQDNGTTEQKNIPTRDEAVYLRWIAKRVTLDGYIPKSLQTENLNYF